jgi:alkaline phosphatase D
MDRARFERLLTRRASRRRILVAGAAAFAAVSFRGGPTRAAWLQDPSTGPLTTPTFGSFPFTLGVASGDPLPDGVVLWTRLAPDPIAASGQGGMDGQGPIEVRYEVAADEAFAQVLQQGAAVATPELAHTVHVDATGLEPGRTYFYRFMAGEEISPVGRTKTAPAAGADVDRLRFAFASCQHYESGYYTAHRNMAADDLDLVIFLGDYIYEGDASDNPTNVRRHNGPEIVSLADYRNRLALYKSDPDLQASHAAFPWAVTWDDHEVDNNWTADRDQDGTPPELFLPRRADAFQAYYEHQPLRPSSMPRGADMNLYRRLTWGDLAEFSVLDSRQYRTDHPCGDGLQVPCPAGFDPTSTLLGPDQERWLLAGLDASTARWNVLAQQIMAAEVDREAGRGEMFGMDSWNGYPAARDRIFGHLLTRQIANPVVITGDVHAFWVNDLKANFADPESATVGAEFVGTSISSNGDEDPAADPQRAILPENPHVKFMDGTRRGYVRCDLNRDLWRTDLMAVETVRDRESAIETLASFVVEDGRPGIEPA